MDSGTIAGIPMEILLEILLEILPGREPGENDCIAFKRFAI